MPKSDSQTAVINLSLAFEHYNEYHPHSALGYRSPREYQRRRKSSAYRPEVSTILGAVHSRSGSVCIKVPVPVGGI